jgi:hypothetical protein
VKRLNLLAVLVWWSTALFSPIWAQQALSTSDLKSIQGTISDITIEFEGLHKEKEDIESWRNEFHQRRDIHDSHAPCRYEHGHAEQCDWFVREARHLNDERDRIDGRVKDLNDRAHAARSRLQFQMGVPRSASFSGCFNELAERMHSCAAIVDVEGAAICLTRVWEGHC